MHLVWDPNPIFFTLPLLERPIAWYGVFFAVGFLLASIFNRRMMAGRQDAKLFCDSLFSHVFFGTLIGARLGHLMFYEPWSKWLLHPVEWIAVWEGGLASHGGVVGILIALYLFARKSKEMTFLEVVDLVTVPTALAAVFIRLGNFVNQEILGTPTHLPWAVTFLHPIDGSLAVPRHPAQLYEALIYATTFFTLWKLFPKWRIYPGRTTGLFFLLVFGSRFFIEFIKEGQSAFEIGPLLMGQYLSLPLVAIGIYLLNRKQQPSHSH